MPPRLCCGCGCYEFRDTFDREDGPLGSDYEVCSGTWEIADSNAVGTGKFVIKHSRGTPYGWLFTCFKLVPGVTYTIGAFRGTTEDPCSGTSSVHVEIVVTSGSEISIEIPESGKGKVLCTYEGEDDPSEMQCILFCLGKDGLQVGYSSPTGWVCENEDEEQINPLIYCNLTPPTNKYFEIEASGGTGEIYEVWYQEHRDAGNPLCPRCLFGSCFGYGDSVIGWNILVEGITAAPDCEEAEPSPGSCCDCPTSVQSDVFLDDAYRPCEGHIFSETVVFPQAECPGPISPGPGEPSTAYIFMSWELDCTAEDFAYLTITIGSVGTSSPNTQTITRAYAKTPVVSAAAMFFTDQGPDVPEPCDIGGPCCLEGITVTIEPILLEGCCYDPLESGS